MGGSKKRDVPSNLIVLCSAQNTAIESNAAAAKVAKQFGWKLESWQAPLAQPVYDMVSGVWYLLDDSYGRIVTDC